MDWKSVGQAVKKYAPMVGTVIGGPLGAAAGGVVSMVASALGVEETPEAVMREIETNPNAAIILREIESKEKVRLQELVVELDKAHLADVQSARARQIAITKATGKIDINLYVLAWTIIIGFFALCGILMYITLPEGSSQVVFMLFGGLVAGFTQVISYFFGSSKSSKDKTDLLSPKQ